MSECATAVELGLETFPYLADHRLQGAVVLPGSVYVELALMATRATAVEALKFERAFFVPPQGTRTLRLVPTAEGFQARSGDRRALHASGRVVATAPAARAPLPVPRPVGAGVAGSELYARLRVAGNEYGPAFQAIERIWPTDGAAVARLRLRPAPARAVAGDQLHPAVIDGAVQALAASSVDSDAFALVGIERLALYGRPRGHCWAQARITEESPDLLGDVVVSEDDGRLAIELEGVRLRRLPRRRGPAAAPTFAVAATFTSEPLREALEFWAEQLELPPGVEFAPYDQMFQQLLDPASVLSRNRTGANVVLMRPEDWLRGRAAAAPAVDAVAGVNTYETDFLRDEIFGREVYGRHGIELRDGDCVFDVGANIGMFTLWVHARCRDAQVYAFEPSPPAFAALSANAAARAPGTKLFDCAVADADGVARLTTYPAASLFSGLAAHGERDRAVLRRVIETSLRSRLAGVPADVGAVADRLARERLHADVHDVRTRALSSVIREHDVECIDLLKVDTEGAELAVLDGVDDEHWPIVRQVVVEAHGTADAVADRLRGLGFEVAVDEEEAMLRDTGMVNVFARRPGAEAAAEQVGHGLERIAEDFVQALVALQQRTLAPCVVAVCPASTGWSGRQRTAIERTERRLAGALAAIPGVALITPEELFATYPVAEYADPRADALGHVPYTREFFAALGTLVARRFAATRRPPPKVLALDCDGTLWDGVAAEDGPSGVRVGAAHRAVQELAVREHDAGMLVCLCSRNNPRDVLDVFEQRPDMPLGRHHIAASRLTWAAKSTALASLAAELELGLDSFVLLDDDPLQCAEVRANCPDVVVLQLPSVAREVAPFLAHVWAFDRAGATDEDRRRTALYRDERERRALRGSSLTFAAFIADLGLHVDVAPCSVADRPRVVQLMQRTNQFTTTASRRTEAELSQLFDARAVECLVVRVVDRFGDYGLVGALLLHADQSGQSLRVDALVLSCRTLGRGVEHRMLARLGEIACHRGLSRIEVAFRRTARNMPARQFLESVMRVERGTFTLPAADAAAVVFEPAAAPPVPEHPQPGAAASPAASIPPALAGHVAAELRDTAAIVDAIARRRVRSRPLLASDYAAPRDDLERELGRLWQQILGIDRVGIDDNFFDLGGSSLHAVQVMAKLPAIAAVDVSSVVLFERPTVRALASALREPVADADVGMASRTRGDLRRALQERRGAI